jgi:hypothetical protein
MKRTKLSPIRPNDKRVRLDLNSEIFEENLLALDKTESTDTQYAAQAAPDDVGAGYRDSGLKWEKIESVKPPSGIAAVYSLRITQGRRATANRQGDLMRFLTIQQDHDSTYGKK